MTCMCIISRGWPVFLRVIVCFVFLVSLSSEGWSDQQATESGQTARMDIEKRLSISMELNKLMSDIATQKKDLERKYSNHPEKLKEELFQLSKEFQERQDKIFGNAGITQKDYIEEGRESLNAEDVLDYVKKNPDTIPAVKHETPEEVLKQHGYDLTVEGFISALGDPVATVRWNAAGLLGKQDNKTVIPALQKALQDQDTLVQRKSAASLCMLGNYSGVSLLMNLIRDEDFNSRIAGILLLAGCSENSDVLHGLIKTLQDENKFVRLVTTGTVGKIQNPLVIDALKKASDVEEDAMVRSAMKRQILDLRR